jgi:hypothetical protein
MRNLTLILGLLFSVSLFAVQPEQIQSYNFDFDDNIFTTAAKIYVWNPASQTEEGISTANWALYKETIGKEGHYKNHVTRPDFLREFGDTGPYGEELFAWQVRDGLAHGDWKSPSFEAFVAALSDPHTRKYTTIITARMHSPRAIMKGLSVLYSQGLIPAYPDVNNIFSVLWPNFDPTLKGASPAASKAKVMTMLLDQIEATPMPQDADEVYNQDGTGLAKLHLWGFSDDDYGNFSKARDVLSPLVRQGRWPHVKILLIYTGLNNRNVAPHSIILKSNGEPRATIKEEGRFTRNTMSPNRH